jgi:acetyltransferase-like isoleucine patch superfamily enzyme
LIHESARVYGKTIVGANSYILENVILGYPDRQILNALRSGNTRIEDYQYEGTHLGENALIRANTVIYCKVRIGKSFQTGHNAVIRENTSIGDSVSIGTNVVIEGNTRIGNNVNIQSNVFIPIGTAIEDFVFIGPNAVLTNDKYPPFRKGNELKGPILKRGVSVGASAIILPGVEVGEGSMVAAGALVTRNVPPWKLAIGSPAEIMDLSEDLKVLNEYKRR